MGIPRRRLMADISDNNERFNPVDYRRSGIDTVGIKATEGVGDRQAVHGPRADAAHRAGLKVVHYHFAHPDTHANAAAEAAEFLAAVIPHWRRGDRVAIDIERPPTAAGDMNAYIASWHLHLRMHAGPVGSAHAWLYMNASYVVTYRVRLPRGWRLWLAGYAGPILSPRFFGIRFRPWVHQFTDGIDGPFPHVCAGIGNCDVSALSRRAALGLHIF